MIFDYRLDAKKLRFNDNLRCEVLGADQARLRLAAKCCCDLWRNRKTHCQRHRKLVHGPMIAPATSSFRTTTADPPLRRVWFRKQILRLRCAPLRMTSRSGGRLHAEGISMRDALWGFRMLVRVSLLCEGDPPHHHRPAVLPGARFLRDSRCW